MKIIVTGGAGFIGSHVVDAYVEAGYQVTAVDNLSTGRRENVNPSARFYELDICSDAFSDLIREEKPDLINHHAAQIDVRKSVQSPSFDAQVNIVGSLNLLEAAREVGTGHLIFASTGGAIYGEQDYFPADEEHKLCPLSPYGVAKLSVEKYLFYYGAVHGMRYTILRYANVYGPRQNPKGEAGVVAVFCERMTSGLQPIINGDGKQTRDYVYVDDLVKANLLAVEKPAGIYNIGTGVETDVNQIFHFLQTSLGADFPEMHGPAKAGEQLRSVLNAAKAAKELGWAPKIDLETGLKLTIEYYKT